MSYLQINKMKIPPCEWCDVPAIYEFTDAEIEINLVDEDGASATSVETIIIGHACGNHVEEVNKYLMEKRGENSE